MRLCIPFFLAISLISCAKNTRKEECKITCDNKSEQVGHQQFRTKCFSCHRLGEGQDIKDRVLQMKDAELIQVLKSGQTIAGTPHIVFDKSSCEELLTIKCFLSKLDGDYIK